MTGEVAACLAEPVPDIGRHECFPALVVNGVRRDALEGDPGRDLGAWAARPILVPDMHVRDLDLEVGEHGADQGPDPPTALLRLLAGPGLGPLYQLLLERLLQPPDPGLPALSSRRVGMAGSCMRFRAGSWPLLVLASRSWAAASSAERPRLPRVVSSGGVARMYTRSNSTTTGSFPRVRQGICGERGTKVGAAAPRFDQKRLRTFRRREPRRPALTVTGRLSSFRASGRSCRSCRSQEKTRFRRR